MKGINKIFLTTSITLIFFELVFCAAYFRTSASSDSLSRNSETSNIQTVVIGDQIWMTENLNVTKFRNGEPIPVFTTFEEWSKFGSDKTPACADFDNDPEISKETGKLYNWYAVDDPRGLCPQGFRIPTEEDFSTLLSFVGGEEYNSEAAEKELIKGGGSGFDALFGGWCCMDYVDYEYEDTSFFFINFSSNAAFWSSTETGKNDALNLDIGTTWRSDSWGAYLDPYSSKDLAFSVRCIKE